MKNAERRLRNIERLVKLQLVIIIALLIGLCAFATNIYHATELGEAIQAVETQQ
jgi:hypothetical protein